MSVIFAALVFVLLIIILFFVGVFSVRAAIKIKNHSGYSKDDDFKSAHTYLTWASIISWLGIGWLILVIVIYIAFGITGLVATEGIGLPFILSTTGYVIYYLLGILLILVLVCGLLTVGACIKMRKSPNFDDKGDLKTAYDDAIYASVASLATLGILFITVGYIYYSRRQAKILREAKIMKREKKRIQRESTITDGSKITDTSKPNVVQSDKSTGFFQGFNTGQIQQLIAENPELISLIKKGV
jgi:magnesium-transporting ATPase (P-type)